MRQRSAMWVVCVAMACNEGAAIVADESPASDQSSTADEAATSDEGSSSDGAGECNAAATGVGIAYLGTAEPGVRCTDEVCALGCCGSAPARCIADDADAELCADAATLCDGPEDCGDAELCCRSKAPSSSFGSSHCTTASTCEGGDAIVCTSDIDCPAGACVRAWSDRGVVDLGVCQDGPASACVVEPDADCGGADLRGVDLYGASMPGASFCGADLSEARLDAADLGGADLAGAKLVDAELNGVQLTAADCSNADFTSAGLGYADFTGAVLTDAVLHAVMSSSMVFADADLQSVDFSGAFLADSSFRGADMRGATLTDAVLTRVDLTGADLRDAELGVSFYLDVTCPDGALVNSPDTCDEHLVP